ncbi:EPIDERMAL PATTERNING FACTOR-like protein 6 [Actinidia eriantha]|uniref:EPIDERMAL PATTERNING FACTOR-like protein 6 n=1 Tax=Actinidia eriantha TaxID=165200 RepID=UPI0025872065|nr:EPIDERMAL PATTERNING FACTOR-like protein 6 [Actinidia eriantha]
MRGRVRFCCFVMILQVVSWVGVTCRPFAPNHDVPQPGTEQRPQTLQVTLSSKEGNESMTIGAEKSEEGSDYKGVDQIGSRPPSCEHKCYGCMPCDAIQVPTTSSRVGVQYTNYEPESWKCKCGPSLYSP